MEHFISRRQAADTLSISPQSIDRLIAGGKLRSVKVGKRRVGILADSLSQYVASITEELSPNKENKQ